MKKGNYIANFYERIENFKKNIMDKIGKENFSLVFFLKKINHIIKKIGL